MMMMDEIAWIDIKKIIDDKKAMLVGQKFSWGQRYGGQEIGILAEEAKKKISEKEPTVYS